MSRIVSRSLCVSRLVLAWQVASSRAIPRRSSEPRAGDGNRTHVACLEGRGSTIELHPRVSRPGPSRLGAEPSPGRSSLAPRCGPSMTVLCSRSPVVSGPAARIASRPSMPARSTWVEQDSNLRRQCHQIYSLAPLAAWVSTRLGSSPVGPASRRVASQAIAAIGARRPCDRAGGETRTHNLRFTKPCSAELSYASNQGRETPYYIVWRERMQEISRSNRCSRSNRRDTTIADSPSVAGIGAIADKGLRGIDSAFS